MAVFFIAVMALILGGRPLLQSHRALYVGLFGGFGVAYLIASGGITFWMRRSLRRIREEEIARNQAVPPMVPVFEYRSQWALLGLPLVHIRIRGGLERGPVRAWFAVGDGAIGALFGCGAYAIAPISFGGLAIGLLPLGGLALGPVALGGFSLAIWSLGGFALGWQAFGGCAVGWHAAMGDAALARDFALGAIAQAVQANNDAAQAYIGASRFFQTAQLVARHMGWLYLIGVFPIALWWRNMARKRKQG
jgi:hypothetical protein